MFFNCSILEVQAFSTTVIYTKTVHLTAEMFPNHGFMATVLIMHGIP